jgi:hypothetical protein
MSKFKSYYREQLALRTKTHEELTDIASAPICRARAPDDQISSSYQDLCKRGYLKKTIR